MAKTLGLCILFATLTGCASFGAKEPSVTLHGDLLYKPAERACIEKSAKQWEDQTSGIADINIEWDYDSTDPKSIYAHRKDNRLIRMDSTNPRVVEVDNESRAECLDSVNARPELGIDPIMCMGISLLGQVSPPGGIHSVQYHTGQHIEMGLVMDRIQDPHRCQLTAMHELGHVLGVGHIDSNVENIMYPAVEDTRTACMKPEDLLGFCFANDCGNVAMKPCEAVDINGH